MIIAYIVFGAAGGFGGGLRTDPLPGRVHPGGAGHEDQPDRGQGAGRRPQPNASWARLTIRERLNEATPSSGRCTLITST